MSRNIRKIKFFKFIKVIRLHGIQKPVVKHPGTVYKDFIHKTPAVVYTPAVYTEYTAVHESSDQFVRKIKAIEVFKPFTYGPCLFFELILTAPVSKNRLISNSRFPQ